MDSVMQFLFAPVAVAVNIVRNRPQFEAQLVQLFQAFFLVNVCSTETRARYAKGWWADCRLSKETTTGQDDQNDRWGK
jgi:hypothetical protein